MRRPWLVTAGICLAFSTACGRPGDTRAFGERLDSLRTAAVTDSGAREDLTRLISEFPKGGDLHSHLSGTVQVRDLLAIAEDKGFDLVFRDDRAVFCGFTKTGRRDSYFLDSACQGGDRPERNDIENVPASLARDDAALREVVREALTIDPGEMDSEATEFDEFNLIFGRLDNLTDRPSVMAEAVRATMREAFRTHVSYLELKINPIGRVEVEFTGGEWTEVPVAIEDVVSQLRAAVDDENRLLKESWAADPWLSGGTAATEGAGDPPNSTPAQWPANWPNPVEVRFIVGGDRTRPLAEGGVTQMEAIRCEDPETEDCPDRLRQAYYLTTASPDSDFFVGIDFARIPEVNFVLDRPLAEVIEELSAEFGPVKMTLHAGETNNPLWGHHVADAIDAGAQRIGHGFNMATSLESLERFCVSNVLVEVSLTSNLATNLVGDLRSHPFPKYFRGGACGEDGGYRPVSLNTDDPGLFETDLSLEFLQAVQTFDLSWDEIKLLARNSLLFAFAGDPTKEALLRRWEDQVAALEAQWEW